MRPTLRKSIASTQRDGYMHQSGTEVVLLEALDPERRYWIVEVKVPDSQLEGDAWFDAIEVEVTDLDFSGELQEDITQAQAAAPLPPAPSKLRDIQTAVRSPELPGTRSIPRESSIAA